MSGSHSHSRLRSTSAGRSRWHLVALGAGVVLIAVAVAVGVAVVGHSSGKVSASPTTTPAGKPAASNLPLVVVAVTPADGASGVPSDATITVVFSEALSAHSPVPTLTPAVPGTWEQATPTTLAFVAAAPLVPSSSETVTVPAGTGGMLSAAGRTLAQGATVHFGVAPGTTMRLQQLLAQLGYLPVSFTPAG